MILGHLQSAVFIGIGGVKRRAKSLHLPKLGYKMLPDGKAWGFGSSF
jgi:hypothetical protein